MFTFSYFTAKIHCPPFFIVLRRSDKEKSGLQADYEDLLNQIEALKKQKVFIASTLDKH